METHLTGDADWNMISLSVSHNFRPFYRQLSAKMMVKLKLSNFDGYPIKRHLFSPVKAAHGQRKTLKNVVIRKRWLAQNQCSLDDSIQSFLSTFGSPKRLMQPLNSQNRKKCENLTNFRFQSATLAANFTFCWKIYWKRNFLHTIRVITPKKDIQCQFSFEKKSFFVVTSGDWKTTHVKKHFFFNFL